MGSKAKKTYSVWSDEMDPEVTGRAGRELVDGPGLTFAEARAARKKHGGIIQADGDIALPLDEQDQELAEDIFDLPAAPEVAPAELADQPQIDLERPFSVPKPPRKRTLVLSDPEQDKRVYEAKEAGDTWKAIAMREGWGWNGTNMDGGRAKRAYLRHARTLEAAEELVAS